MRPSNDVEKQIEAAYDYRGHVTIRLKGGGAVGGFVFNRDPAGGFMDVMVKDSDVRRRIGIEDVLAEELTGRDYAETFEEGLKRTGLKKA